MSEVKTTVQEFQSYSTVLQTAVSECTTALAPSKIRAAVSSAAVKQDTSCNLILYGMIEKEEEDLRGMVKEVLGSLTPPQVPVLEGFGRIGRKVEGKERPVKIKLRSKDTVSQVLAVKTSLKDNASFSRVFIAPDLTSEQRLERGKLVCELKERREREKDKRFCIRKGTVVELTE